MEENFSVCMAMADRYAELAKAVNEKEVKTIQRFISITLNNQQTTIMPMARSKSGFN
jgi:hypothetical protein